MKDIDTIIQEIEDIELTLRLREAYPRNKYNLMKSCSLEQISRLSSSYWALDYADLGVLLDDLKQKYLKLASVNNLIKDINPSK